MNSLTKEEIEAKRIEKLKRLKNDFEYFAGHCLFIRVKSGAIVPFRLNQAQRFINSKLEKQRQETGMVRAIILKGRQLGASTLIQARYYWRLWGGRGLKAFILTHEQDATDNMFSMAKRYHENCPEVIRPETKSANAKELAFAKNDCSYAVATAGSKGVGRSSTLQLFHGSEVAFWPNAETHIDGAFQALANAAGTERILESTANGIGNVFQRRYMAAARGDSEDQAIFVPWYWGEDYVAEPPLGFCFSKDWCDYGNANELTPNQLYWAYLKNRDMANAISEPDDKPCWKFKQEYPSNADEAFVTSGNTFIPSALVAAARKAKVIGQGPLIIGIDPARGGGDKTGVIDRRGRRMGENVCEVWDNKDLMATAGQVVRLINKFRPSAVNIDVGGLGSGLYDRLVELGYGRVVNPVNFGQSPLGIGPTGDELYANRRAEMWDLKREWYSTLGGVQVPDSDSFHADETAPIWGNSATRHNSNNELILEPKDKIRERLHFSPDLGDAAALTFAVPIAEHVYEDVDTEYRSNTRSSITGY